MEVQAGLICIYGINTCSRVGLELGVGGSYWWGQEQQQVLCIQGAEARTWVDLHSRPACALRYTEFRSERVSVRGRGARVGVLRQDRGAARVRSAPPSVDTAERLEGNSQLTGSGGKVHVPVENVGRKVKGFISSGSW